MSTGAVRSCGFCKKSCTDPKFLPCFHAFCKTCLKFQITSVPTNRQWEGFSCPSCKTYIKAIDSDKPLASWADQFPDTIGTRKPFKKRGSSEDSVGTDTSARSSVSSRTDSVDGGLPSPLTSEPPSPLSPGLNSPISPGPISPVKSEPMSPVTEANIPSTSEPSTPDRTEPVAETFDSVFTPPVSPLLSMQTEESIPKTTQNSETDSIIESGNNSEQQMCLVHPWKPIIVSCRKCDSLACGQCLIENHPTCKGEDFSPIPNTSFMPNMSQLEEEVHKVPPGSDMVTTSTYQLQQTRELIRQKIKQIALLLIQNIKREENQMVKKVQWLYHDEIWRLSSGINPSESLLKEVHELRNTTEDLTKLHSAAVILQADEMMEKQNVLLGRLKAVDFACVPPDIDFVEDYESLAITLGDLVVDQGFYPKHDMPVVSVEEALETLTVADVAASTSTNTSTSTSANTPKKTSQKSSQQAAPPKSKTKSLVGRLLSPIQKNKSKFYVKVPEL